MKVTNFLYNLVQGIWLDDITRDLLDKGTLETSWHTEKLGVRNVTSFDY